ncbi:hypothetical protein C4D60_Mb11t07810 [Musa balbisiana]|uniref:RING-type domain-containing protein n=1 Tax=Musa balbisiana TaxID=52838 RepID=A0A4S8J2M6_MUSBA|nr:hypothetical protein C4D60_Mb11t07810 [Musa balbisiana]
MEGRGVRRSVTLSEQLAVVNCCNLRDLLKVQDEDEVRPSIAVAACGKREASSAAGGAGGGRTLLDIMREDQETSGVVVGGNAGNGINWKSFKDRLRLRRAGAAWAASSGRPNQMPYPALVVPVRPNAVLAGNSEIPVPASTPGRGAIISEYNPAVAATSPPEEQPSGGTETSGGGESSDRGGTAEAATAEEEQQPARVSLMALLEQTDRLWSSGGEGSSPAAAALAAALVAEEDECALEDVGSGTMYVCCVCMVRHKGAAFIPCGHTFCRLCSRELWVNHGSCPLCNGYILEILDIF